MEEIKAHLDTCPECAREVEEISRISLLLKEDLETFVPSSDFNEKLMARIQNLAPEKVVGLLQAQFRWWSWLLP
jgi:anti-sigma factor RsiW